MFVLFGRYFNEEVLAGVLKGEREKYCLTVTFQFWCALQIALFIVNLGEYHIWLKQLLQTSAHGFQVKWSCGTSLFNSTNKECYFSFIVSLCGTRYIENVFTRCSVLSVHVFNRDSVNIFTKLGIAVRLGVLHLEMGQWMKKIHFKLAQCCALQPGF